MGNREVPRIVILGARADLCGAWAEAYLEEGGTLGKPGFHHASERMASERAA